MTRRNRIAQTILAMAPKTCRDFPQAHGLIVAGITGVVLKGVFRDYITIY